MKTTIPIAAAMAFCLGSAIEANAQQPNFPPLPKHAIDMVEQGRRNAGIRSTSELEGFAKKVRTIQIDKETTDDVERKLGKPTMRSKMKWGELWIYTFTSPYGSAKEDLVSGSVEFNSMGRVSKVSVTKNNEELYSQGLSNMELQAQQAAGKSDKTESIARFVIPKAPQPPANPIEGQVYFNTATKAFLGWNGTAWIPLNGAGHGN